MTEKYIRYRQLYRATYMKFTKASVLLSTVVYFYTVIFLIRPY